MIVKLVCLCILIFDTPIMSTYSNSPKFKIKQHFFLALVDPVVHWPSFSGIYVVRGLSQLDFDGLTNKL